MGLRPGLAARNLESGTLYLRAILDGDSPLFTLCLRKAGGGLDVGEGWLAVLKGGALRVGALVV